MESTFPIIESELLSVRETQARRESERAYAQRRKDVAGLYQRLSDSSGASGPLPTLPEFRQLPMVQRIQYKPSNTPNAAVAQELKNSQLVVSLVNEEVTHWRNETKTAFAALLGTKSWRSASSKKLHPVDRLTARFRCKTCDSRGHSHGWNATSLDFDGACKHQCRSRNGAPSKRRWSVDNFIPDVKASQTEVLRIIM